MNCCKPTKSKTQKKASLPEPPSTQVQQPSNQETLIPQNNNTINVRHDVLLRIPECRVHLMDEGEAVELGAGDFELQRITDGNVAIATAVKVGAELQWPLTKDEPVVKLDEKHYLFSLLMNDGTPLSYGVAFASGGLEELDAFLRENCSFTASKKKRDSDIDWKEFAPAVDSYNSFLAKAIADGTGYIVKGIFKCSNAYTNKVQKGGETILIQAVEEKNIVAPNKIQSNGAKKSKGSLNKSLKRARKLSKMTQKLSKSVLNVVESGTGAVMTPIVESRPGKAFLNMMPGEVLLASLDALNKIIDAAEAAEKQTMVATSGAVTTAVTNRYGESAGEATGHALATAGHCVGTAWNVFKIRKAINPATTATSRGVLKNAAKSVGK
ncbi:senescence/dehydration-associated protein At4g35985, chloroplastic-like isoform X2 [Salvia hispanica]|uniref:senescence/dehydration-associated protein At4g35985, chloroplastic-like isoform X2 n=1 Tax=Salvia hispanica TaxID=49212 RepID=UPI002009712D|nr:senescence/dehydration-associated protein At4g35985, chloroplastic-like isoform X2 [Salvia hispanica]